jgi:hypothetical protein
VIVDRAADEQLVDARRDDENRRAPHVPPRTSPRTRRRHVYARLEAGPRVRPTIDLRQAGPERIFSVPYLKVPVGGRVPVAPGIELPAIVAATALAPEQSRFLEAGLRADR